jgi:cell division protein FtsX
MKKFIYVLMILSAILVIYNTTQIDYSDPLGKDSIVAIIVVIAGLCAILILAILNTSNKIKEKVKKSSRP